jgi:hypothetical protein
MNFSTTIIRYPFIRFAKPSVVESVFIRESVTESVYQTLTHSHHWHRIPPNMNKHGLGTMTMTTTSGYHREAIVHGLK